MHTKNAWQSGESDGHPWMDQEGFLSRLCRTTGEPVSQIAQDERKLLRKVIHGTAPGKAFLSVAVFILKRVFQLKTETVSILPPSSLMKPHRSSKCGTNPLVQIAYLSHMQ
jgi:hypothetical protein